VVLDVDYSGVLKQINPLDLSPSQEAASYAATQELPNILQNLQVHH
jgi:hypothetical protein